MKIRIFALSILCSTGAALNAMDDEVLLTFENKTSKKVEIALKVTGKVNRGRCWRDDFDRHVKCYDLEPGRVLAFTKDEIDSELKYYKYRDQSELTSSYGFVKFEDGPISGWYDKTLPIILTLVFDESTGKYKVETTGLK